MAIVWTLIRKNPFEAATIGGLVILLVLAGVLYVRLAATQVELAASEARVELLEASVRDWQGEHDRLRAATDEQREAVLKLVQESADRQARALAIVDAATKLSADLSRRATEVLRERPPPGVDPCVAAAAAFTAELQAERGEGLP